MIASLDQARLIREGWAKVERDDRLLDILPHQTREKGIELWEKWTGRHVLLMRFRVDYPKKTPPVYCLPLAAVRHALLENKPLNLLEFSATC